MPNYRRWRQSGGSYFFTLALADRSQSLLLDHIALLRDAFATVQQRYPFRMDATVILPEHLHCIWTLPVSDIDYSTRWRQIKSMFSRGIKANESRSPSRIRKKERGIWQRRFWEHMLRDENDMNQHIDYIHFNPVKHGYVNRPVDWQHSSLHRFIENGILTPD
ncbi:MAG TPA: transposase [Phycisphaerales bacterium]|nr:transposase [Phycisphaerales bacterium]HCD32862.1 transposase [Phycisphaerales bacterium]|tara:strand:+ start:30 stop:518 length:489 start_codon:yes stop_codon:yes gene_type:complete